MAPAGLSPEVSGQQEVGCLFALGPPQIIQRQLEQVEERQRQLEERGVAVEKALRGEAGTVCGREAWHPRQLGWCCLVWSAGVVGTPLPSDLGLPAKRGIKEQLCDVPD